MQLKVISGECRTSATLAISLAMAFGFLGVAAPNSPGGEPTGPKTVPNPFPCATVARIQSVILGEYAGKPGFKEGEIKIVEIIKDSYRVEKIKKSLCAPLLHAKRRSFIGDRYHLIFLDKDGKVVAAASFYLAAGLGYVLHLSPGAFEENGHYFDNGWQDKRIVANWDPKIDYRAYAIPFGNDWPEAIGYTPGW